MNPVAVLLGPLYELYIAALGEKVGVVVSYTTLLGLIALIWWCLANRNEIIYELNLRPTTIGNMIMLLLLTFVIYVVVLDNFGFPVVGAIIVAVSSTLLFHWTMTAFEGEPI